MAKYINENDLNCFVIDNNYAEMILHKERFVLDYSTLIDVMMALAKIASQMETFETSKPKESIHQESHSLL